MKRTINLSNTQFRYQLVFFVHMYGCIWLHVWLAEGSLSYWPTQLRELRPEVYRMGKVECLNFQCQQYVHNNSK